MKKEELSEEQKALNRFDESTKILKDSSKQLDKEMEQVDSCFNMMVDQASPKDKARAIETVRKAKALLAKLKKGANVNDIVKQLNNLA
jgi:hypothetical protein